MRPSYAYAGIGIVFILAFIAFVDPNLRSKKDTPGTTSVGVKGNTAMTDSLKLSSSVFKEGESIPPIFTCDGTQSSPPLSISGAPVETKSLALIMEDPDVPKQLRADGVFLHWVLFNIPPATTQMGKDEKIGITGANGAGKNSYVGPCPPPQYLPSEHRYVFSLYALDIELPLKAGANKDDILNGMEGHILSEAKLIGKYKRK